jgi:hypothetical protein
VRRVVEAASSWKAVEGYGRSQAVTEQPTVGPRDIPDPIKRAIRQRCGFGCVLCGLPLYEYDHLLGWANVHRHVAEEITLLCDQHHRERTNGLLPDADVASANQNPFNLRSGVSRPYDLHYSGAECAAQFGNNTFAVEDQGYGTVLVPIVIDGMAPVVFTLADGHLMLSVTLFDQANRVVLQIDQNQLIHTVDHWDVEFAGRTLVIRAGQGDVFIDMTFEPPNKIRFNRGRILFNGVEILLAHDYAWLSNIESVLDGFSTSNVNFGIVLGPPDPPGGCAIRIPNVNRYLGKTPRAGHMAARRLIADMERRRQEMDLRFQRLLAEQPPSHTQ